MKMSFAALAVLLWVCTPAHAANAEKIQCWSDEHGARMCGDHIPPKYAGKEREVMNNRGVIIRDYPRALTPAEQIEAEKAAAEQKKEEDAARTAAEHQHAYDRYLLETYSSPKDLEKTRDERLKALDTRMEIVQKAIESGQSQLDALVARKQSLAKGNFPPDKALEKQIKDYRRAIIENPKALQALHTEHDKVVAQFDRDIARYKELTQTDPDAAATAPPPLPDTP